MLRADWFFRSLGWSIQQKLQRDENAPIHPLFVLTNDEYSLAIPLFVADGG